MSNENIFGTGYAMEHGNNCNKKCFMNRKTNTLIKVLSLGVGLAIGIVLIAKVCFEWTYDHHYRDMNRIYKIYSGLDRQGEEKEYAQVSGGVAPGFKTYIPGVEEATRLTGLFDSNKFYDENNNLIKGDCFLADSCFFKIFNRPILYGNVNEVLGTPKKAMVSRSFAETLGGVSQCIGKIIYNEENPELKLEVGGVFEDFPKNGSFVADILISLETYPEWSRNNWVGNDRYIGYVKLAEDIDPNSLTAAIRRMQEKNQPLEEIEKNGLNLWYELKPFTKEHLSKSGVRNMMFMFSVVAFLLIFAGILNYILIALYSVVRRSKEVGVRKCYGADVRNIYALFFKEAGWHFLLSLFVSAAIIMAFSRLIFNLMDVSVKDLFTPAAWWVVAGVCLLVLLVSAFVPARLFVKIPVSTAFRNYRESKRRWKQTLLLFQFMFSAFLFALLLVIAAQYNKMVNDEPGYEYKNLVFFDLMGIQDVTKASYLMDLLKSDAHAAGVEACSDLPFQGASGNNVYLPDSDKELFNVADQYWASEGFFDLMGFKLLEGRAPVGPKDIAVSRSFVDKMALFADWSDGVVGKSILVSEHSQTGDDAFTICGVYEDYRIGTLIWADPRPSVRFCLPGMRIVVVKLHEMSREGLEAVSRIVKEADLGKEVDVLSYKEEMRKEYDRYKKQKNTLLIGGIFTLVIALIGLIGYIEDETNRRSAEMAIRKINGATSGEVMGIFVKDILGIALIALLLGGIAAYFAAQSWLKLFSEQINLSFQYFLLSSVVLALVIGATVVLNSLKIAYANPVDSLKND